MYNAELKAALETGSPFAIRTAYLAGNPENTQPVCIDQIQAGYDAGKVTDPPLRVIKYLMIMKERNFGPCYRIFYVRQPSVPPLWMEDPAVIKQIAVSLDFWFGDSKVAHYSVEQLPYQGEERVIEFKRQDDFKVTHTNACNALCPTAQLQ